MSLDGKTTKQAHAEFLRRNATAAHVASAPVLHARPLAPPVATPPTTPVTPGTPGTPGSRIEWQNIPKSTAPDPLLLHANVIEYLKKRNNIPANREDILNATGADVSDPALLSLLKNNPFVRVEDGMGYDLFSYRSKFRARNREDLLSIIKDHADGLVVSEIKDSYLHVERDLRELASERRVILLINENPKSRSSPVVFYNPDRFVVTKVPELRSLWHEIAIPRDTKDLEDEMKANGLKPTVQLLPAKRAAPTAGDKPKKRRKRELTLPPPPLPTV